MKWILRNNTDFTMWVPKELKNSTYVNKWVLNENRSDKKNLFFKSYDSNECLMNDIKNWESTEQKKQIEYASKRFDNFEGHVFLDSICIK